jgi:hypothetical protein
MTVYVFHAVFRTFKPFGMAVQTFNLGSGGFRILSSLGEGWDQVFGMAFQD